MTEKLKFFLGRCRNSRPSSFQRKDSYLITSTSRLQKNADGEMERIKKSYAHREKSLITCNRMRRRHLGRMRRI